MFRRFILHVTTSKSFTLNHLQKDIKYFRMIEHGLKIDSGYM